MKKRLLLILIACSSVLLAGCTQNERNRQIKQENGCIVYQCSADACDPLSYVRCPKSTTTSEYREQHGKTRTREQVQTTDE